MKKKRGEGATRILSVPVYAGALETGGAGGCLDASLICLEAVLFLVFGAQEEQL